MRAYSLLLVMLVGVSGACGPSDRQTADEDSLRTLVTDSAGRTRVVDTAAGAVAPAQSGSSTSDPDVKGVEHWRNLDPPRKPAQNDDHAFLRTMADNNEGMVEMVAFAKDRATGATTIADIGRVREARAQLRTELIDMIRNKYQEVFVPVATPVHDKRLDSLDLTEPAQFNREFYQRALEHHRQWISRLDALSPRLKDAQVKAFATRLRSQIQGEIDMFSRGFSGTGP